MSIIIQKAVKHIILSHQAEISGKTYEFLTAFYAKQTQFPKNQMNVSFFYTKDYENKHNWTLGENKPKQTQYKANSNPIQTQSKPIQSQ